MASKNGGKSPIEKVAAFIVDKRKAFYLIYIIAIIFCLFSSNWVKVDNTLTDYLADDTETRRGLTIMDDEFTTYATAKIMVDNISYDRAKELSEKLTDVDGIKEVDFDDSQKHYSDSSALFSITFDGSNTDAISETALESAKYAV